MLGPDPKSGTISLRDVPQRKLVGVVRLTIRLPGLLPPSAISGDWALPILKSDYTISAAFGMCGALWASCHTGQDFAAPTGTQVYAATGGVVTSAAWAGDYGNRIIIKAPDGTETWYCHLSAFDVTEGTIPVGTPIGKVGSTGNTTGPHLHFEVRTSDGEAVDPLTVLRDQGLNP